MDEGLVQKISERSLAAGIIIGISRACCILTTVQGEYLENREAYEALNSLYRSLKAEEGRLEAIHDNNRE